MKAFITHSTIGLAVVAVPFAINVQAQLPAFPGADGAAQFASGGRGGIVYHVTKLNSELDDPQRSSPGTLLYGLSDGNFPDGQPRTIVFDVAGVFHLGMGDRLDWDSMGNAWDSQSRQSISATDLTIAGQSAPGPVIIMGGTLKPSGSNIVIRNITIAAGYGMKSFWEPPPKTPPVYPALPTSFTMDAIDVSGQNVMLDHLDALYCSDESISCNENANNLTIQYCTSGQAQNYQGHGYGHLLQPNTNYKLSFLHNLDAHLTSRLPRVGSEVGTGALNDFRNNVTYNWINNQPGYAGTSQYSKNNFIQNFYLEGKGGDSSYNSTSGGGTGIFNGASAAYTSVHSSGNLRDTNRDSDPNDATPCDGISYYTSSTIQAAAYNINIGVTLGARDSFTNVLRYVGSRWWERDYDFTLGNFGAIDTPNERLIHEVITGTGRIEAWADDPYDTNALDGVEWRSLWSLRADTNGVAPFNRPVGWDTDGDGMPDDWELEHGLDPAVANNNGDFDADGYTDLEEYLNEIAAWPAPAEIFFTGNNNRYAEILNWRVTGVAVNISGIGNLPTSSPWQPSRYDRAAISNANVLVDAVGQHAGTLRLLNSGTLNVSNGWLNVANTLEIGASSSATLNLSGGRLRVGTLTKGPSGIFNFTGGVLSADTVNFSLVNDGGTIAPGDSPGQTVINGNLTLQTGSSLQLELGAANPNDSDNVVVNGDLTLGGTLDASSLPGFGPGTYTLITYTGTLGGSLALGSMPSGFAYTLETGAGTVQLVVQNLPYFQSTVLDGANLVMTGTGPTNRTYHLLAAPDLLLPINLWTPVATNVLDEDGHFSVTNVLDSSLPQTYFRLELP